MPSTASADDDSPTIPVPDRELRGSLHPSKCSGSRAPRHALEPTARRLQSIPCCKPSSRTQGCMGCHSARPLPRCQSEAGFPSSILHGTRLHSRGLNFQSIPPNTMDRMKERSADFTDSSKTRPLLQIRSVSLAVFERLIFHERRVVDFCIRPRGLRWLKSPGTHRTGRRSCSTPDLSTAYSITFGI
jgi:hypothetical protein